MTREDQIIQIIDIVVSRIMTDVGSVGDIFDNAQKAGLLEAILFQLDEMGIAIESIFPEAIAEQYATGIKAGEALLIDAGISSGALVATSPSKRIHTEALNVLISDGMSDMKTAIQNVKDNLPGKLDEITAEVVKEFGAGIVSGENRNKVTARISDIFAKRGLTSFTVEDKNGNIRNLPLDFYAKTVTRTKLRSSHNQGSENRYRENKVDLVIVDEHYPTCKECASKQGIVISLTGDTPGYVTKDEIGLPPYHPNCRHTIKPYMAKFKTAEEIREDKRKKYKPGADNRTDAQKRAYQKEQAIKRKANQEKKDYEALKAVLGDRVPKTLGAFRRLRRKNDLGWQELQREYRTAIKEVDEERGSG